MSSVVSHPGSVTDWRSLSIKLMERGRLQELRSLLTTTRLETPTLSFADVCKPSKYNYKDGRFLNKKPTNPEYNKLKQVYKRLKKKRDTEARIRESKRLLHQVKISQRREATVKTEMVKQRQALKSLRQDQMKSHRYFAEAQTNYGKVLNMYVNPPFPPPHTHDTNNMFTQYIHIHIQVQHYTAREYCYHHSVQSAT